MPNRRVTIPKSVYVEQYKFKVRRNQEKLTGGAVSLEIGTPNPSDHWFIERIAVHSDSASTTAKAYLIVGDDTQKGIDWSAMMDVSLCGTDDAADERQPPYVAPGERVEIRWTGLTIGDSVWTNVQISSCALVAAEVPSPIAFDRFAINIDRSA